MRLKQEVGETIRVIIVQTYINSKYTQHVFLEWTNDLRKICSNTLKVVSCSVNMLIALQQKKKIKTTKIEECFFMSCTD